MSLPTFAVAVLFEVEPAHANEFFQAVQQQSRNSLAREPDCHQFDVCVDTDDPTKIFLYETYADEAAFAAHRQTDHMAEFNRTINGWVANKQVKTWTITPATT